MSRTMINEGKLNTLKYYIVEREAIRLRRLEGRVWPWTEDTVLQHYKFTNVKRHHDKTTVVFKEIYDENTPTKKEQKSEHHKLAAACLMNAATFRYFGSIAMAQYVEWQHTWSAKHTQDTAAWLISKGITPYTSAYVISNGASSEPKYKVVVGYLTSLFQDSARVIAALHDNHSWQSGAECMRRLHGFGGSGFMVKEVLQDYLLMWPAKDIHDGLTWTPVGPGARHGLNRLFDRPRDYNQTETKWLAEIHLVQSELMKGWLQAYPKAEPLSAHDVQFACCEIDKYFRAKTGEGRPKIYHPPTSVPHLKNGIELT